MVHFYDNTLKVKQEAQEVAKKIDWNHKGKEEQFFNVGDVVTHTEKSRYRFGKGTICEVYQQNGYFYYIIKENNLTFRNKDLKRL